MEIEPNLELLRIFYPLSVVLFGVNTERNELALASCELLLELRQHPKLGGGYRIEPKHEGYDDLETRRRDNKNDSNATIRCKELTAKDPSIIS